MVKKKPEAEAAGVAALNVIASVLLHLAEILKRRVCSSHAKSYF